MFNLSTADLCVKSVHDLFPRLVRNNIMLRPLGTAVDCKKSDP